MNDIERNDVDIKKLFDWSDKVTIFNRQGNPVKDLYLKIVGEADWNRARIWALRDSADLRRRLRDEESDERKAYIQDKKGLNKEVLVEYILMLSMRDFTNEALGKVSIPFPKEPRSDASLEQQEVYQAKIDKYAKEREEKIREEIQIIVERERESFGNMTMAKLYDYYETVTINELCKNELNDKFLAYCTQLGTYKTEDLQELAFPTFEDFTSVPQDVKIQLMNKYSDIDLSTEELKK